MCARDAKKQRKRGRETAMVGWKAEERRESNKQTVKVDSSVLGTGKGNTSQQRISRHPPLLSPSVSRGPSVCLWTTVKSFALLCEPVIYMPHPCHTVHCARCAVHRPPPSPRPQHLSAAACLPSCLSVCWTATHTCKHRRSQCQATREHCEQRF